MRRFSVAALAVSSLALGACAGGEGLPPNLTLGISDSLCGLNCPENTATTTPTVTGGSGANGAPLPPTTNTGNTTTLATAKRAVLLESDVLINAEDKPGLAEVANGTTATSKKALIDAKSSRTGTWPKPVDLDIYNAGTSLGAANLQATYAEYRGADFAGTTLKSDQELQLWTWGNSYGAQYRNVSGAKAIHQAWIFGGNQTAATDMPVGGTAAYTGRYTGTANVSGFIDSGLDNQEMSYNGDFATAGDVSATADFGAKTIDVTLTPVLWKGWRKANAAAGTTAGPFVHNIQTLIASNDPDYNPYTMGQEIIIKGTFGGNAAATTSMSAITPSDITGDATFGDANSDWISGKNSNPVYGAFFGTGATEVTGVFNLEGMIPSPIGGNIAIQDDRRAFMQQSGVFHGEQ